MLLAKNVYSILLLSLGFFLTQQDLTNTGGISLEEGIGTLRSFSGGVVVKNPHANAGDARDMALIPGSGRSPGEGNSNALQYSCLGNPMDRGAWWAKYSPWGLKESNITKRLILLFSLK